jgi:hypothetical protein
MMASPAKDPSMVAVFMIELLIPLVYAFEYPAKFMVRLVPPGELATTSRGVRFGGARPPPFPATFVIISTPTME